MDDALGALLGWILLIAIAIYLLSLAIFGMLLAAGMAATAGASAGVYRLAVADSIRKDAYNCLSPSCDSNGFRLTVDPAKIVPRAQDFFGWTILISLFAATLVGVVAGSMMVNDAVVERNKDLTTIIVFLGGIGGLAGSYYLVRRWSFEPTIRKIAEDHAVHVSSAFTRSIGELAAIEERIETVAVGASLAPPPSREFAIFDIFEELSSQLAVDADAAGDAVMAVLNDARSDEKAMRAIADDLADVQKLHLDATDLVASSGFRSLYTPLDVIRAFFFSPHLSSLVERREFEELRSQIAGVREELKVLLAKAKAAGADQARQGTGASDEDIWCETAPLTIDLALKRLSARHGDSPSRLRHIYLAL